MDFERVLLSKKSRELYNKITNLNDNTFNIYRDRLFEINKILGDNSLIQNTKRDFLQNLSLLASGDERLAQRRINVFYFIYNLNHDII
jgi:hypothetical protein